MSTIRIYALRRDEGTAAFQTGILANALPRLRNLRNVHLIVTSEGIVPVQRMLQTTSRRLRGLTLKCALIFVYSYPYRCKRTPPYLDHPTAPPSSPSSTCTTSRTSPTTPPPPPSPTPPLLPLPPPPPRPPPQASKLHALLSANKSTLRTIVLDLVPTPYSPSSSPSSYPRHGGSSPTLGAHRVLPAGALSTGNLTRIFFTGAVPAHSTLFGEVLAHGRQLETLNIACALLSSSFSASV